MTNGAETETTNIKLDPSLPPKPTFYPGIQRAPSRGFHLTKEQTATALKNALRYISKELHTALAPEFMEELKTYGRIYGYRYRPEGRIWGKPLDCYKGNCIEGKAFQVMIDNNLDFNVALYPYELVTYGETGSVFQNWMQYRLVKRYLEEMTQDQTLVIESGHPVGLFPSSPSMPRVIITNALMVGAFNNARDWEIAEEMGVANFGQMSAGSWLYIGPQGIVHGTFSTLLNTGRKQLGIPQNQDLAGVLFVSSGLGGMSGAQPKAIEIAGGVGIIAEVDRDRIDSKLAMGWVSAASNELEEVFARALEHVQKRTPFSIAYHGNIIDLLQYAADHDIHIPLLTDQTSCHNAYNGGYCPQGMTSDEKMSTLRRAPEKFKSEVQKSLRIHYGLIKRLYDRGTYFFDYGNGFLKAVFDAGIHEVSKNGVDDKDGFILPSYVEDIMGPELFDYGYGPFRWVCLSGDPEDLKKTDQAAMESIDPNRRSHDRDNWCWIRDAWKNNLVVGTQSRILYQDAAGRIKIALKFNDMVRKKILHGPILVGRDHQDPAGTDSPFRETSNIKDGSNIMAEMSTQCFAGNCARGMSLVALHNGGGVGIGRAVNGGYAIVLDGSERVDRIIRNGMLWDTMGGLARRSWARNEHSMEVCTAFNKEYQGRGHITLPNLSDDGLIKGIVDQYF